MVATMAHEFKAHEFTEAVLNATAPAAETGAASDTKNTSNGSQYTDAREGAQAESANGKDASTSNAEPSEAAKVAVAHLKQLRPPPWSLSAIIPDDKTTLTVVAHCGQDVADFVDTYNGSRNLYYSVNPVRNPINKKAAKTDIAAIEYALGDLDPAEGETSEAAKARYLQALETFEFKPTSAIDSGNGIQCLWKIGAIPLGEPVVSAPDRRGKTKLIFRPEDQVKIDDAEARIGALMERLGAKKGTQNIDRIFRLPGTINLPNEKKRKAGRVACPARLIEFNDIAYPLEAFAREPEQQREKKKKSSDGGERKLPRELINMLYLSGDKPAGYQSRSHLLWASSARRYARGWTRA